jgi:hypothetical protein
MDKQAIEVWNTILGPVSGIEDLKNRILCKVDAHDDELVLYLSDTNWVRFYHAQDCCESVTIEDICGDLQDLVGEPLLEAEQVQGYIGPDTDDESYTWTFYKFATRRGAVTVRWYGSSNGYYSESVDIQVV